MANKKENKILRKTLSLTLAMLVSILGIPLARPQQASATEASEPKYLSDMTITATASTTWSDEGKYNGDFYKEIIEKYDTYTTAETALKIDSADKLAAFAKVVNDTTDEAKDKDFEDRYVELTKPINLLSDENNLNIGKSTSGNNFSIDITGTASNVWVPIGTYDNMFKGNFDGGNCKISNMTVLVKQTSGAVYAGLFGYAYGGSIKNTGVTGNVYASSSSSSSYVYAGGLAGRSSSSSISNSYATGDVYVSSSGAHAGGLVGDSDSSISNSYATGNIYASSSSVYAGGLVGWSSSSSSISNSYATGDVYASSSSSSRAGGLVGYSYSSISNSYATGNVYASSSSYVYAGGLVGSNSNIIISNSYATGDVYASSSSSSSSSYVYAGELVGYISSSSSISNSYYYSGSTVDAGTTGTKSSYGTGLTMDQMTGTGSGRATDAMGFSEDNWDFNDDGIGIKYLPRLKVITYNETTNPVPKFDAPTAEYFNFKAPANLTYDGSAKEATVTSKISEIPNDKITIKYYSSTGTNLTSAPTNAGTYIVKIDVAACDKYEAQTDITADHWTFTIAKADPIIGSTSTTAAYKPGLILSNVTPPPCGFGLHGRHVDVA